MKKVIFISALAIAAAASCTKSDIVDTKFDDAIGFEAYIGRDAMTKGDIVEKDDLTGATVYGYYTGEDEWKPTTNANLWTAGLNLVINKGVVADLNESDVRYWANATDQYTFLAYAPINNSNLAKPTSTANPTLVYSVDPTEDFSKHVDVLRAEPIIDETKNSLSGTVNLVFKHTLSRITVKAKVDKDTPFDFHIKSITLKGTFNTAGTLALAETDGWDVTEETENATFTFYSNDADPNVENSGAVALGTSYTDYCEDFDQGHMMIIPTEFSASKKAILEVVYTTNFAGVESRPYSVKHEITTPYLIGTAYTYNLDFYQAENNDIKFTVDVTPWDTADDVTTQIK